MINAIVLDHLAKKYDSQKDWAVFDFSLSVKTGELFCLVGPSGCGKTTILKLIAGLEKPDSGEMIKPNNISLVFQSGALLPWLTVKENVSFAPRMKGLAKRRIGELTEKYLRLVNLEDFISKYPRELSGGQRQRVGLARALAIEPEVLLLDEPFSSLDPLTTEELHQDLLRIWRETKTTILLVSHLLEEAVLLGDRVGVMKEAKLQGVVEINLPRPRKSQEKGFLAELEKIKKIF